MKRSWMVWGGLLAMAAVACGSAGTDDGEDESGGTSEDAVSTHNITGSALGLQDKEIALTLDDGPGPRTVELAQFLAAEKVPVTFFMVGKNAKADPATVAKVVEISKANGDLFFIGNHSMTHAAKPLPSQGTTATIGEIMNADAILKSSIAAIQPAPHYASPTYFFRPPYGAFISLGAANIARINDAGASKYTGPVFWDIGGELAHGYSADWACWSKHVAIGPCLDGYIAESNAHKKGVVLMHDVHSKTVDMLMGKNTANGRSFIKEMRAKGYKFVSLRAHDASVTQFGDQQEQLANNDGVTIDATVTQEGDGKVKVDVRTVGGAKATITYDNDANPIARFDRDGSNERSFGPGQHFVTVAVLDAAGHVLKQERYTFTIAASIDPQPNDGSTCVGSDVFAKGKTLRIFHGKTACGGTATEAAPGECYKYAGVLTSTQNPAGVGGSDWNVEWDLSYAADPNDKSHITASFESVGGDIEQARRTFPSASRAAVGMDITSHDCASTTWRGKFTYSNGTSEDLVIRP